MTDAQREQFMKQAGELHDQVHEAAALVDYHTRVEIGWAPEEAIPILAEALQAAYEAAAAAENEACAKIADETTFDDSLGGGYVHGCEDTAKQLAEAIRARREQGSGK